MIDWRTNFRKKEKNLTYDFTKIYVLILIVTVEEIIIFIFKHELASNIFNILRNATYSST